MLEVQSVSKIYGCQQVLKDVSFSVSAGQIVAVIGPNGAGKTTLFNILVGILKTEANDSRLDGTSLTSVPVKSIGFLPESPFFHASFTPQETLLYDATMRAIPAAESHWEELVGRFDLYDIVAKKNRWLSQGMKKRVALACAFLGSPRVIILDEPLNGLDIQSVIALKEQLLVEKKHGAHILLSSHVLSFLDGLADSLVFLKGGQVVHTCEGSDVHAEEVYKQLFLADNTEIGAGIPCSPSTIA